MDIRKWRKKQGISQEEAARSIDVSLRTWVRWENGEAEPRITLLVDLEAAFPGAMSELVGKAVKASLKAGSG